MDRATIARLLEASPPLVEGYLDLGAQLQPNGFDLTLRGVEGFTRPGQLGLGNAQRRLAETSTLSFDRGGWLHLPPGPHLITLNEVVNLPLDLMALGKPRSSLLRCGVAIHNAVWDAGYRGRSQALLVVYHPLGFRVARDSRVLQLVFYRLEAPVAEGYQGRFQRENL
ncbi:MAG: deoxyuridine 5'-triphosphate nucleotidohydrolase [Chloroflexi bacterium]|nr:deoxyuridine 5'-triphosphate nucleotidohydrolase [Chloroflexota bacterium]